jgi:hypothetical protein
VPLAALIYAVVEGVYRLAVGSDDFSTIVVLGIVAAVLLFAGPVLVQGALVEIVRSVHEARRPETISTLLRHALQRLHSLFWASVVYGVGVVFGSSC